MNFSYSKACHISVLAFTLLAPACNTETDSDIEEAGQRFEVPDDPDLEWAANNPHEGFRFMNSCKSVAADGSTVESGPLPVGDGAHIECETSALGRTVDDYLDSKGNHW